MTQSCNNRVLIVDDDPMFRLMLEKFLHKEGFDVVQAESGEAALRCFAAQPALIVLMDADMPGMSGFQCCEQLQQLCGSDEVAVLMLTALDDEGFVDRAFTAGAMDYLTKPVHWAVLRNRLKYLRQIRHAQQAQRISEARKSAIWQSALDGILTIGLDGEIQEMNPAASAVFGYTIEPGAAEIPIRQLVPALALLGADEPVPATFFECLHEVPAVHQNGQLFPIEMALGRTDIAGGFYTLILRDISARKQAQREQQLAATILETTADAVMITSPQGLIQSVNPAFSRITGYSEVEAVGQKPSLLRSGRHDEAFYQAIWQAITDKGHWQGEIWNRRKCGEVYPEWLSISRVMDADSGDVSCHVAMFNDISVRKKHEQRIWHQAHHDSLTQLPNRSYFNSCLNDAMAAARGTGHTMALLFIDLDHFKAVNDSLGHTMGDQLLVDVANRLRACVRSQDIVARLGGDEFTAILPDVCTEAAACAIGERILAEMIRPFDLGAAQPAYISASIGMTFYPHDAEDVDVLLNHADAAMYASKQAGRNQLTCFEGIRSLN